MQRVTNSKSPTHTQRSSHPFLFPEDEPDWENPDKQYSEAITREQQRITEHDALICSFPVWWYSMPAILKGDIDRVWNYGFAYGPRTLPVQSAMDRRNRLQVASRGVVEFR